MNRTKAVLLSEVLKHLPGRHEQLRHAANPRQVSVSSKPAKVVAGTTLTEKQLAGLYSTAKKVWSRFLQLREPDYKSEAEMKAMGGSDAMAFIDLHTHRIYSCLERMPKNHVDPNNPEQVRAILAHEIGHHAKFPGDLGTYGRMMSAIKTNMGFADDDETKEQLVHSIQNLWTDLLINRRIFIGGERAIVDIYRGFGQLKPDEKDPTGQTLKDHGPVWRIYLRTYELLFGLKKGELDKSVAPLTPSQEIDSQLIARAVKMSDNHQVGGAGIFASLIKKHLDRPQELPPETDRPIFPTDPKPGDEPGTEGGDPGGGGEGEGGDPGGDSGGQRPGGDGPISKVPGKIKPPQRGKGRPAKPGTDPSEIPGGLSKKDNEEGEVSKEDIRKLREGKVPDILGGGEGGSGGSTPTPGEDARSPIEYRELLKKLGYDIEPKAATINYYKDLAKQYAVRLPDVMRPTMYMGRQGSEPWTMSDPLSKLDIDLTMEQHGIFIPEDTTRMIRRAPVEGTLPAKKPVDLAIYVDCSGSMPNPQEQLSFPALAGTILATNALNAGSRVKVVLWSDKNHPMVVTDGFSREESDVLGVLTSYSPGGTDFPNHELDKTIADLPPDERKGTHVVILSDEGLDTMRTNGGRYASWGDKNKPNVIDKAPVELNGATAVLDTRMYDDVSELQEHLESRGWNVYGVSSHADLINFARVFSEKTYGEESQ